MSDEKKTVADDNKSVSEQKSEVIKNNNSLNNNFDKGRAFDPRRRKDASGRKRFGERPKEEFEQRILDIARVTRVMKGGKRMSFRACVAIGDKKGRVSVALGKGADVTLAVNKAVNKAKKNVVTVPIINDTIPHQIQNKFGSSKILIKPASEGRGVIAGGVVRVILDLAGVKNVTSKILGTNNKVNNAKCAVMALDKLKKTGLSSLEKRRNKKEDGAIDNKDKKINNIK